MKLLARVMVWPIRAYQRLLSPLLGDRCRFYPSCSEYAAQSLAAHGPFKGLYLAAARLSRCHPWNPRGFDEVPDTFTWRPGRQSSGHGPHAHDEEALCRS